MTILDSAPPAPAVADWRQALLTDRPQTLTRLYRRTFPGVRQYVLRHGGRDQDAQDIFQDALVIFYEKTVAGALELTAEPGTYLVAVCRNLWQREVARRARHPHTELDAAQHQLAEEDTPADTLPTTSSVLAHLEQLGEKCRSILLAFYYFGQPLSQIAAAHEYRSIRSATVQKFKCLERLRNAVRAALPTFLA